MAMPMAYCTPGAEVEKVQEAAHTADCKREAGKSDCTCGAVVISDKGAFYKWRPCNPRKRGFIVKVKYPGDETYSSDCVEYVEVKFEKGKAPERCVPTQLNLVKVANEAALAALKNNAAIKKAKEGVLDDMRKPVVVDQTGVGKTKSGKGLSKFEAEDLATE